MRKYVYGVLACGTLAGVIYLAGCFSTGDLGDAPFKCTQDIPDCPDGYHCKLDVGPHQNYCVRDSAGGSMKMAVTIPKTGMYPGTHPDPMIDMTTCSDNGNEPNDDFAHAVQLDTGLLTGRAICPAGDVDYYHATVAREYVRVIITYNITVGDLDLAFIDASTGMPKTGAGMSDGTAKSNGCITSGMTKFDGDVYVAVVGAKDMDQAPYSLKFDRGSTPLPCGTTDGGI